MVELKVKVQRVGNSLRVAIPAPIVEELKIKVGDTLGIDVKDGKIILRKLELGRVKTV